MSSRVDEFLSRFERTLAGFFPHYIRIIREKRPKEELVCYVVKEQQGSNKFFARFCIHINKVKDSFVFRHEKIEARGTVPVALKNWLSNLIRLTEITPSLWRGEEPPQPSPVAYDP